MLHSAAPFASEHSPARRQPAPASVERADRDRAWRDTLAKREQEREREWRQAQHAKAERGKSGEAMLQRREAKYREAARLEAKCEIARNSAHGAPDAEREENRSIYMEAEKTHAFLPCGHLACCGKCAGRLRGRECPICREATTGVVRIYK